MNVRRLAVAAVIGLVLVLVAAAVALPLLLDVDRHRPRIERALAEATGWDARLGDLGFSVLRGLSVTASPVALHAPEGGSSLDIGTVRIRAELVPLLRGELRVRSVELVQPRIELVQPSAERGWVLPLPQEPTGPDAGPESSGGPAVAVRSVSVRGGVLRLEDRSTDPPRIVSLEQVDVVFDNAAGTLTAAADVPGGGGELQLQGELAGDLALTLADLDTKLVAGWLGEDLLRPGGRLSGEVDLNLPRRIAGRVSGRELRLLAGEQPLERAEIGFDLAGEPDGSWRAERLEITAGDARLDGSGSLTPDLALSIELPPTPLEPSLALARALFPLPLEVGTPGAAAVTVQLEQSAGEDLTYTAKGSLSAASFAPGGVLPAASDLQTTFTLDRTGALDLRIDRGSVGGGPLTGRVRIDRIEPIGTLHFDGKLAGAPMGTILAGILGGKADRIRGPTGLAASIALDLSRGEPDVHALRGSLDLLAESVSIADWDLERAVRLRLREKLGALGNLAQLVDPEAAAEIEGGDAAEEAVRGVLESLASAIRFDEVPWKLERVELRSSRIAATGGGTFDPLTGAVDLRCSARLSPELTRRYVAEHSALGRLVDGEGRLNLPLRLRGPLTGPEVDVDVKKLLPDPLASPDPKEAVKGLLKGLIDR